VFVAVYNQPPHSVSAPRLPLVPRRGRRFPRRGGTPTGVLTGSLVHVRSGAFSMPAGSTVDHYSTGFEIFIIGLATVPSYSGSFVY
jgi:hypothetical protein